MIEKKTIFDFEALFQVSGPFDNWMKSREETIEIEREIAAQAALGASISDESPYQSGDIFVFNYDKLFLVRNYGENGQEILWSTPARSGNGKYLNNPKYADVKYDEEKHVGGPIPPGWYYLDLSNFTADRTSSDKKIKAGVTYKGYEPNRRAGAWGEWAKPLYPYGFWSWSWSSTQTFGRDGFFLHEDGNEKEGGNSVGSGGCIATTLDSKGILIVMRDAKQAYGLGDSYIDLLADEKFKPPVKIIYHLVVEGDTLFSLSKQYNVAIKAIQKENDLKGTTIIKGKVLRIPIQDY